MAEPPQASPQSYMGRLMAIEQRLDQLEGMTQEALRIFAGMMVQGHMPGIDERKVEEMISETMRRVTLTNTK